jgi:hypothetical protein
MWVLLLLLLAAALALARPAPRGRPARQPARPLPALPGAAALADERFQEVYAGTFSARAPCDAATVSRLASLRDEAVGAIHDARMRLPNDLAQEHRMQLLAEDEEDRLTAQIEDVRRRCRVGSLPGRLSGWHHGWYRAANDA